MLYTTVKLKNPWSKKRSYDSVFFWHKQVAKNKSIEFEVIDDSDILLSFELDISFRGKDHAGPSIMFGIFGSEISFRLYDHRHWDHQSNEWNDAHKQNLDGL